MNEKRFLLIVDLKANGKLYYGPFANDLAAMSESVILARVYPESVFTIEELLDGDHTQK